MEEKLTTIKGLDDQILDSIEKEDEIQQEINESANFLQGIHEILIQNEEKLSGLTLQTTHNANGSGSGDSSGAIAVVPMGEQEFIPSFLNLS